MSSGSVQAAYSEALSRGRGKRWVLVDKTTGEIVDDAQGYGFKTPQGAYAAHSYKNRPKKVVARERRIRTAVKRWCRDNPEVVERLEADSFYDAKDTLHSSESEFTPEYADSVLKELGFENLPFTGKELLRFW